MVDRARSLVDYWLPRYPSTYPWIDNKARKALRCSEDIWLNTFKDADSLARERVHELINWKRQGGASLGAE